MIDLHARLYKDVRDGLVEEGKRDGRSLNYVLNEAGRLYISERRRRRARHGRSEQNGADA